MSPRSWPHGPVLELSFYFGERATADAFADVLAAAQISGARPTWASVERGPAARSRRYGVDTDDAGEDVPVSQLAKLLGDPHARVHQIGLLGLFNTGRPEVLSWVALVGARAVAGHDANPIAIWAEDRVFGTGAPASRPRAVGRRVYRAFRAIVEATSPVYAAIGVETSVGTPAELREDPSAHYPLADLFVSRSLTAIHDDLRRLFAGAVVEEWPNGLYASCSAELNQAGRRGPVDRTRSVRVAQLLGAAALKVSV